MKCSRVLNQVFCLVLISSLLFGCNTTYTTLSQKNLTSRFEVTSDPPGTQVVVNGKIKGVTPTVLEMPYKQRKIHVNPADHKHGWIWLSTGIAGMVAGTLLTIIAVKYWPSSSMYSSSDPADLATTSAAQVGASIGISSALYGIGATIGGIYLLATSKEYDRYETNPPSFLIGMRRGADYAKVRVKAAKPLTELVNLDGLKKIHFSSITRNWDSPGLDPALQITREGQPLEVTVVAAPQPSAPAAAVPAPVTDQPGLAPVAGQLKLVVFPINSQGTTLQQDVWAKLSVFLNAKLASNPNFQIVSGQATTDKAAAVAPADDKQCQQTGCQLGVGQALGADRVLRTKVARFGSKCALSAVLFEVGKGVAVGGHSVTVDCSEEALIGAIEQVSTKLQ